VKDISAVLLQKQRDIERVRHEIEALRYVVPLLMDEPVLPVSEKEGAVAAVNRDRNRWPIELREMH